MRTARLIDFPRLRAWRANRRWRRALVQIADQADAEGWSVQEILRANRAAHALYKEALR